MEIRKIVKDEVFTLFHKKVDGGWKVVRWEGKSQADAVKRISQLLKKVATCNSNLEELQSIIKIGVEGLHGGSNSINWSCTEERINYRMYDYMREAILIAILFDLYKPDEIKINPLQLVQG